MIKDDMSPRAPVIRTEFWIEGNELDHEEFSRLVGFQPVRSGTKGDLSSNPMAATRGVRVPETYWLIEVERNSYSMDEGIQEMLTQIWPHREKVLEYLKIRPRVEMGITVVIHIDEDRPVYEISPDSIRKMADLGCSFMIDDIYPMEGIES